MNRFLSYKKPGETPLEALEILRREKGIDASMPMTYAGRLDPMAEGLLLILAGDECKKKDDYLGLDKEYEIEVLLGIGSDTGDVLGIITSSKIQDTNTKEILNQVIIGGIQKLVGKRSEKYPAFSSKTVGGKALFQYTKEGTVDDIEIPTKEIEIYSIDFIGSEYISINELCNRVIERVSLVTGDFRQDEIIQSWKKILEHVDSGAHIESVQIVKLHVRSSSGAYMRTLAEKLGTELGIPALAWQIKRTKIGEYSL